MRQLEYNWAFVAQGRMQSHRVIEVVDVVCRKHQSFGLTGETRLRLVGQQFSFVSAKEALGHRVVIALGALS